MDNQQAIVTDFEFGWFVGVLESEGSISLGFGTHYNGHSKAERSFQILPRMTIATTDAGTAERVQQILGRWAVGHHVREGRTKNRQEWKITILGAKRVRSLLERVRQRLLNKRLQADKVWWWIESRLSRPRTEPYSQEDIQSFLDVRRLNGYRVEEVPQALRDYMRRSAARLQMKI